MAKKTRRLTGRKMKQVRETLGFSQSKLARRIGCSRSHVANMENGYRPLTNYAQRIYQELRL